MRHFLTSLLDGLALVAASGIFFAFSRVSSRTDEEDGVSAPRLRSRSSPQHQYAR